MYGSAKSWKDEEGGLQIGRVDYDALVFGEMLRRWGNGEEVDCLKGLEIYVVSLFLISVGMGCADLVI